MVFVAYWIHLYLTNAFQVKFLLHDKLNIIAGLPMVEPRKVHLMG